MDNSDWILAVGIVKKLGEVNDVDESLKNFIIQKAKTSNHYLVKKAIENLNF